MTARLGFGLLLALLPAMAFGGSFAPAAGLPGSTAIAGDSALFVGWASSVESLTRGPQDIANPGGALATVGLAASALGPADATSANPNTVVSLGDGGQITLGFAQPITDGPGFDFAVFENGFGDQFLELGLVEVSSNGVDFLRFAAVSQTPTAAQVGSFSALDPTNLDNLAGKYRAGFGTPFDLAQLAGVSPLVDVTSIRYVRIIDVVGTIGAAGKVDSLGNKINDPYPTAFASSGFDLDAVGALHTVPEPSGVVLLTIGFASIACLVRRKRESGISGGA